MRKERRSNLARKERRSNEEGKKVGGQRLGYICSVSMKK